MICCRINKIKPQTCGLILEEFYTSLTGRKNKHLYQIEFKRMVSYVPVGTWNTILFNSI